MKITVYELLGLMKDGKAPKKVKYDNLEYKFDGEKYVNECGVNLLNHVTYAINIMTHRVEIIEEDKNITEVLEIELLGQCDNWLQSKTVNIKLDMELNPYILNAINKNFKLLYNKQCEIVDAINKLKNK